MQDGTRAGRYAARPGAIPWAGWKKILKRTYTTISDADLSLRCAGVAFFSFLSVFPVLACFLLVYGIVSTAASLQEQLAMLQRFVPDSVYEIIQTRLDALVAQPQAGLGTGLVVSFLIALWSGSRGTNALISTISAAYHQKDKRGFIASATLSLGLTLGMLVGLTIVLFAIAGIPVIVGLLPFSGWLEKLALWVRWPILGVFVFSAFTVLYRLAPDRESAKWKWIAPGALTASIMWLLLSVVFSIYVEQFGNYSATFGSLSVAVVMMLWIYYSAMVIAFGAALNAEIEHQTKIDTTTGPSAPMGERGAVVADNLPEQSKP